MSNIKPLYDRLVVKPIEAEETSLGGIIIPDAAKEKPTKGEVIAVGEGKFIDATGGVRAPKVKVGDKVIYGQYSGSATSRTASSTRSSRKTTFWRSWPKSRHGATGPTAVMAACPIHPSPPSLSEFPNL